MAFSSSQYEDQRSAKITRAPYRFQNVRRLSRGVSKIYFSVFRQLERPIQWGLLLLEPELAHRITLKMVSASEKLLPSRDDDDEVLSQRVFGLLFKNPIGVAAGLDKDAEAVSGLLNNYGFGFVEVGTVTPRRQLGNIGTRVFRLRKDDAIINRFGFNSAGMETVAARLALRARKGGVVGVNIGANKDSTDRGDDYVRLIETFAPLASYFTVNISSPNTPGLRDLQQAQALDELLERVIDARERASVNSSRKPILLKIAPDLSLSGLDDVVGIARKHQVDGMIVSNTTVTRPGSVHRDGLATESGGLSGTPLFKLSTRMLAEAFVRAEGAFPLIGVGGIDSGAAAIAKIKAGATLIQLYTALVYHGMGLVEEIKADLVAALKRGHRNSLAAMVGVDAADITAESWPT